MDLTKRLQAKAVRKTSVFDVMRRLLQPKNLMASITPSKRSVYLSIWSLIRGDVDSLDVSLNLALHDPFVAS